MIQDYTDRPGTTDFQCLETYFGSHRRRQGSRLGVLKCKHSRLGKALPKIDRTTRDPVLLGSLQRVRETSRQCVPVSDGTH